MRKRRWDILLVELPAVQFALVSLLAWWVHKHPVLRTDVTISRAFQRKQKELC
jgi:hypothetical protein